MTAAQELIIEDVEWMITTKEWPPRIAERSHMTVEALARALYRHNRPDLASIFAAYQSRTNRYRDRRPKHD